MKIKFVAWLTAVFFTLVSMYYTSVALAWASTGLYARIAVPGGGSAKDDLSTYITGPVDEYSTSPYNDIVIITIKGRKYITHVSNVLLYEK